MSCYFHFTGTPCLRHTNYIFYRSFKYKLRDESKILSLGDFFFLKILQDVPVCIGEIELLWEDKASNQLLASVRLYFRPEHTPDGRQEDAGEHEIHVLGERLVLRLDDLLPLMQEDFAWEYGYHAQWGSASLKDDSANGEMDGGNGHKALDNNNDEPGLTPAKVDSPQSDDDNGTVACGAANVAVMSFPRYCRYRAMMKRLEGSENSWLSLAVVMALGSYSGRGAGCRVMFCKETFYHSEIDDLDIRMDHMMPTLKNANRGKKKKELSRKDSQQDSDSTEEMFANITPTISTSSRPRRTTETSDLSDDRVNAEEQAFLIGLHKFMHDAKIPIGRIPSLGFKQIDLYRFYKHANKLGGYDAITTKRMWKHLYDKMGGNSSNTSAATCTRRHYERLLLPYERHLRKLKGGGKTKKKIHSVEGIGTKTEKKEEKENISHEAEVKKKNDEESGVGGGGGGGVSSVKVEEKLEGEEITSAITSAPLQDAAGNGRTKSSLPGMDAKMDPELLEIPMVRQRHPGGGGGTKDHLPPTKESRLKESDLKALFPPNLSALGLTEQQFLAGAIPGAVMPADFGAAEGTMIPNTNLVYRGGYLVPLHPQQILQTPWGIMASPQAATIKPEAIERGGEGRKDGHHRAPPSNSSSSSSNIIPTPAHSGGKHNGQSSTADSMLFPGALAGGSASNQQTNSSSSLLKPAHTNTPYQPSPYLLTDHIHQRPAKVPASFRHHALPPQTPHQLQLIQILANTSQNLITLLHPTPSGRKRHLSLPAAPSQIFLHPSSTNPLSPSLPSPNGAIPPPAHSHPRKRSYPFDHPSQGVFPSPDLVLDRIKSSTALPASQAVSDRSLAQRQRFDAPRDIFKQTAQTLAASQTQQSSIFSQHQQHLQQQPPPPNHKRKPHHQQAESSNQKRSSSKLKSSQQKPPMQASSSSSSPSPYHMMPLNALELQSLQMQDLAAAAAAAAATNGVGGGYGRDQMKSLPSSNGLMLQDQHALAKGMSAESQLAAAKEGQRLTSALFGAQFTALPRPTKQSESAMTPTSSEAFSPSAAAAAAAALSFNPHIHPAFMSPYLPPGVSPAAMNPQLQMLAGAYGASPAQLAAYEELLRQNGFGSFLAPGGAPAKVGRKN